MGDLGLVMNDPMARACAERWKTVTRRPAAHLAGARWVGMGPCSDDPGPVYSARRCRRVDGMWHYHLDSFNWGNLDANLARIPGAGTATVGQRVWVRECFALLSHSGSPVCGSIAGMLPLHSGQVRYRAAGHTLSTRADGWRPSIHMPKWAARTWGTLVSVTPCDLSTVDDAEAQREGFDTAAEFLRVIRAMYPGVLWFWRLEIEWDQGGRDAG